MFAFAALPAELRFMIIEQYILDNGVKWQVNTINRATHVRKVHSPLSRICKSTLFEYRSLEKQVHQAQAPHHHIYFVNAQVIRSALIAKMLPVSEMRSCTMAVEVDFNHSDWNEAMMSDLVARFPKIQDVRIDIHCPLDAPLLVDWSYMHLNFNMEIRDYSGYRNDDREDRIPIQMIDEPFQDLTKAVVCLRANGEDGDGEQRKVYLLHRTRKIFMRRDEQGREYEYEDWVPDVMKGEERTIEDESQVGAESLVSKADADLIMAWTPVADKMFEW